ncbi:MAG: ThiF family adenylyltransferase [Caloramator sp.]|nr:ThiF family adenylyltransferase [Caloramator sp.]
MSDIKGNNLKICVIGCGSVGTSIIDSLARLGIKNISFIDDAEINETDVFTHSIFDENDIGRFKVEAAFEKLEKIDSEVLLQGYIDKIDEHNIHAYCSDCDIIVDATSILNTALLINDYCLKNGKVMVCVSHNATSGIATLVSPYKNHCIDCIKDIITSKNLDKDNFTLNHLSKILSGLAVNLIYNYINNIISNKVYFIDIENDIFETINVEKQKDCPSCSKE